MKLLPAALVLLTAVPASAQSRVYTNADLTSRPVTAWTVRVTPEELESLRQHQYHAPPTVRDDGPRVYVMGSSPTAGPFGEFKPFPIARRLDGTFYGDPPYLQFGYVGRFYGSGFYGSGFNRRSYERPSADQRPSTHSGSRAHRSR